MKAPRHLARGFLGISRIIQNPLIFIAPSVLAPLSYKGTPTALAPINIQEFTVMDPMNKKEFLNKCRFPKEWQAWNMLSDAMLEELYKSYTSDTKTDADDGVYRNFRLDAFFYWLEGDLAEEQIKKLFRLSFLEKSGKYMRSSINRHKDCTEPLRKALFGYTKNEIPTFNKNTLAELLHFPREWLAWKMYPDEMFLAHRKLFQPGNESDSENERNETFHYWLSRELSEDQFLKLVKLSLLDPDPLMAENIQAHIKKHKNCPPKVKKLLPQ